MAITSVQQGVVGEFLAAVLMILGSNGLLEVAAPLTDDERRDQEVHVRGLFGLALALQVKTAIHLHMHERAIHGILYIHFDVSAEQLVNHPLFWYLFGYLDVTAMRFGDPLFLVPSTVLHSHASAEDKDGRRQIRFQGSMSPKARDMWAPNQVLSQDLATRVLQILHDAEKNPAQPAMPFDMTKTPGGLWVAQRKVDRHLLAA